MIFEEMVFNAQAVRQRLEDEAKAGNPYPGGVGSIGPGAPGAPGVPAVPGAPQVKVTPGNAPKGESATSVGNRLGEAGGLGDFWGDA